MIEPYQIRAARGLLDWSPAEFAKRTHTGMTTIRYEHDRNNSGRDKLAAIKTALETAGVEFIRGGVQLVSETRQVVVESDADEPKA